MMMNVDNLFTWQVVASEFTGDRGVAVIIEDSKLLVCCSPKFNGNCTHTGPCRDWDLDKKLEEVESELLMASSDSDNSESEDEAEEIKLEIKECRPDVKKSNLHSYAIF